jgi:hypothetical protein
VHFACAGSRKLGGLGFGSSDGAASFFKLCPFRVAGVGHLGHFEVWNVVWPDRCRTSDTFSSSWQVWRFLDVVKALAGAGRDGRCFWRQFWQAQSFGNLDDGLKGSNITFCGSCRHSGFGHADDSVMPRAHFSWQAQYFVDLEKKCLRLR